jgi:tetratricopeptide (TPR) repeat protein
LLHLTGNFIEKSLMQFIPSLELNRRRTAEKDQAPTTLAETDRLTELSSWMMILATIRLVCTIADITSGFLDWTLGNVPSLRLLGRFLHETQPYFAFGIVWPLVLAIALRKTRWPELLRAAAATFLVLSICGVLEIIAEWAHTRSTVLNVGSFHLPLRALTAPLFSDVILGLLGTTQLVLEFGVAVWSIFLGIQFRRSVPSEPNKQILSRRARFGRLAVFVSTAFFVLVIRSSVWSAYLEVLNQSSLVREFVLRNDYARIHARHSRPRTPMEAEQEELAREMQSMYKSATQAWDEGRFSNASDWYLQLINRIESSPQDRWTSGLRFTVAYAFNNLAWLMATCPDTNFRDAEGAVTYGKRAVAVSPTDRNCWNTLGVAYYRAGELEEAKNALYRSMELRNEGDSYDWFFLASIHYKLGHKDRAREWYDRAVERLRQIEQTAYGSVADQLDELYRFEVETAGVLGLSKPAPPTTMVRDAMCWTGAEVLGVPIATTTPVAGRLARYRSAEPFTSLFRLNRRTPSPLIPAGKTRIGR